MKRSQLSASRRMTLALSIGAALGSLPVHAQTSVTTQPVGIVTLNALGASDTVMSVPFERPAAFRGTVASVSGSVITLQGTPGFTANQFVRVAGTQPNTYYVAFNGGSKAGQYYTITANDSGTLTVDLAGDVLAGAVVAGEGVRVIPYWTFGTLFPNGTGVVGTASHGTRPTEILLYDGASIGVNFSPSFTYYYFTGSNPGWRRIGGGLGTVRNDDLIPQDSFFVFRQNDTSASQVSIVGSVPVNPVGTVIGTLQANTPQDNFVAYNLPVPLTLAQLNLVQSGAFEGSSSHGARADELYVYDNAAVGVNKSPVQTYYYFTGTSPGWRRIGGGLGTVRDNDVVLQPGQGFIIRKAAKANPQSFQASITPSY